MIDFYIILFDAVTTNPEKVGHGRDGYYFGIGKEGATEYSMYELAEAVGKALVKLGVHTESEPTAYSQEDLVKTFGSEVSTPSAFVVRCAMTDNLDRRWLRTSPLCSAGTRVA